MNINTISAECAHNYCPECTFEDCACECHAQCDHDKSDLGHVFPTDEHDRAWYEENDPQSLVDSINGNFDPLA